MSTRHWSREARRGWRKGLGRGRLRLNANESPWDVPPEVKAEILATMARLPFSRYDYALRPQLLRALAAYAGVAEEALVIGNGEDELIQIAATCLPGPGGRIVVSSPTFATYLQVAASLGRTLVDVPLGEPDFDLRGEELVAAARPGDLVFVCRPANPTGNLFPRGDVVALLDGLESKGAYTVVDEAYREFCHDTLVAEVTGGRWPKAIVLRTLSKAFRLAGLRVGYAIAPPPLVARMEEVRLPYNLSAASMVAALGMLARPELARRTAAACRRLREALSAELAGIPGLTVLPSHTNFLLVRTPCSGTAIVRALAERGVLIRCYPAEPRLAAAVRVSVGDRAANRRLVAALRAVLQDLLAGGGAETSPRQAT